MSVFNEYKINDRSVIVRSGLESDAESLLELKKSYIRDTTTLPLLEHEYHDTAEEEAALINRYTSQPNCLILVAECEGELIGNLDLTGNQRQKLYHTAMLGMGIAYNWQNMGIGSVLIENAINWATNYSPIEIIWLEMYSTNLPGRALYSKFGFTECGLMENFFRGNVIADKISMIKYLCDV